MIFYMLCQKNFEQVRFAGLQEEIQNKVNGSQTSNFYCDQIFLNCIVSCSRHLVYEKIVQEKSSQKYDLGWELVKVMC